MRGPPRAPITDFHFWATASILDASLRLTAQEHHKSRALTRLRAQRFVRNDQGRSRRDRVGDAIEYLLGDRDSVERLFRTTQVAGQRLHVCTTIPARGIIRIAQARIRLSANQRDHAPSHVEITASVLRGSIDMRADWTIRVSDCDGDVEDWFKAPTDVKVLGIAADEDRHRLEVSHGLAGLLARSRTHGLGCDHGFARWPNRIKFGLQFGFGGR
jgi:hypothetical protein